MTAISDSDDTEPSASHAKAIRDGIDTAQSKVSEVAHAALERTRDGLDQARGTVAEAYSTSRERAAEAYATAREKARTAGRSAADGLDSNPMTALIGGLAIGAVIGALLPRTQREAQMLGSVGGKLQDAAREAVDAAKGAGRDKLAELGLSRDHARETMKSLLDGALAAATSAGTAAIDTARKTPGDKDQS